MLSRLGMRDLIYFIHANIEEDDATRNRSGTKGILSWRCNKKRHGIKQISI